MSANSRVSKVSMLLKLGVASFAVMASSQAFAQSVPERDGAAAGDGSTGEIIVTARKRDERLQDVPVSVSAYSGAQLEEKNIRNVEGTLGLTPGLYVASYGLSPTRDFRQLTIRGVGTSAALDPSVGTFIDGVYSPALDFDTDFLDVDRVEVLKGPQGALFGRNTEAGAVNIVTRKPNDDTHVRINVLGDEFNTAQASASISGPLVKDRLFASISALYRYSDYFVKVRGNAVIPIDPFFPGVNLADVYNKKYTDVSPANGQRQETARAALRFVPDDTSEFTLTGHVSHFKGVDQAPGPLTSCRCYTVDGDLAYANESLSYGTSFQAEKRFGSVKANLILGYEYVSSSSPFDYDGTTNRVGNYHDYDRIQKVASAEFRLSSAEPGPFQWLAGIYGFHETNFTDRFYIFSDTIGPGGAPALFNGLWNQQLADLRTNGVAGFGQASYELTSKLEISIGARYSWQHTNVSALERFVFPANGYLTAPFTSLDAGWPDYVTPIRTGKSFGNFSPQGSIRYKFTPNFTGYVTVARGFKAGSYQTAPYLPSDVTPIDPETTTNYEVGFKGNLFNNRLTFELAGYHIDIKDQQLNSVKITNGVVSSTINNASKSKVDGFEATVAVRPVRSLTLNGTVAYTNARFVKYQILPGDTNGDGVVDAADIVDRSGQPEPNTPRWTYSIGGQYNIPIGQDNLSFDATFRHVSSFTSGLGTSIDDPILTIPSYNRLDIGATFEHGPLSFRLFVDNVTNNYIILSKFLSFEIQPNPTYVHNRVDAPRRIGGSIGYKF